MITISNNKQYIKLYAIYILFLMSLFILFKNSSLISITNQEWILFLVFVVSIGLLLYSKRDIKKVLLRNQYKYLKHTYWIGVLILIIGPLSILFMAPFYMLYGVFVSVRVVVGLIYLFLKRELLW